VSSCWRNAIGALHLGVCELAFSSGELEVASAGTAGPECEREVTLASAARGQCAFARFAIDAGREDQKIAVPFAESEVQSVTLAWKSAVFEVARGDLASLPAECVHRVSNVDSRATDFLFRTRALDPRDLDLACQEGELG
jgi:hypothetical protein